MQVHVISAGYGSELQVFLLILYEALILDLKVKAVSVRGWL